MGRRSEAIASLLRPNGRLRLLIYELIGSGLRLLIRQLRCRLAQYNQAADGSGSTTAAPAAAIAGDTRITASLRAIFFAPMRSSIGPSPDEGQRDHAAKHGDCLISDCISHGLLPVRTKQVVGDVLEDLPPDRDVCDDAEYNQPQGPCAVHRDDRALAGVPEHTRRE